MVEIFLYNSSSLPDWRADATAEGVILVLGGRSQNVVAYSSRRDYSFALPRLRGARLGRRPCLRLENRSTLLVNWGVTKRARCKVAVSSEPWSLKSLSLSSQNDGSRHKDILPSCVTRAE